MAAIARASEAHRAAQAAADKHQSVRQQRVAGQLKDLMDQLATVERLADAVEWEAQRSAEVRPFRASTPPPVSNCDDDNPGEATAAPSQMQLHHPAQATAIVRADCGSRKVRAICNNMRLVPRVLSGHG